MAKFILSAFADEAATDIYAQTAALKKHNIGYIELRNYSLDGVFKNISNATVGDAKKLKKILDKDGIKVSSIGSHYGKIEITDDFEEHFEAFKTTVEVAKILGSKYIRIFSFFFTKGEDYSEYRDEVIFRVKAMADYSHSRGVICCHENEKEIYGDTALRCADLHRAVGKTLGGIFDPSNYIQCGEDTIKAFETVKPYLTYFHVKDCLKASGHVVPCGKGDGNVKVLLEKFAEFEGPRFLSLEPHLTVFDGLASLDKNSASLALDGLYRYASQEESFNAAAEALSEVLNEINK